VTDRALRALRAVCATLVPGARPDLADLVAARLAWHPRDADRAEFYRLLRLLESRVVNFLVTGIPRAFTTMSPAQRERYLRGWATSRLSWRRKAFQALKRLTTAVHYTATDAGGATPAWRAIGYPGPSAPPSDRPAQLRPLRIERDTTLACDVVVVGSGAGGAVVAAELAAAGKDVIVLDKGGHYEPAEFTHREADGLERLYDAAGLLATRDLGLLVLQGSCLGGGTVVNYTTSFPTPPGVRAEWARDRRLTHFEAPEFTRALDAVAGRLGVNTAHNLPSGRDRLLIRGLERLGWHHGLLPRNVWACPQDDECGFCGYGCRRDAKQSTLVTYLRDAAARGARIVARADARRVVFEAGRARGVEALVDGRVALRVRAPAVVVAAGSIHSPALLLRSGLSLPALGRHLTLHPATAVFGTMDDEVRPWTGALQAHYSDQFADLDAGYGFKLETAPVHPSLFALAVPWESGHQHQEQMARLSHTTLAGVLLRDRDGGRVTVDKGGNPVIDYRVSRYDAAHLRRGLAAAGELLEAAGAREIWAPLARWTSYRPGRTGARDEWLARVDAAGYGANQLLLISFHQMATCRMGVDRRSSVVNPENAVWDVPGLWVADASVFPSASGANPMLTIMAIAHRAAACILRRTA
jgi:choline dehydrogenase-like flavoprotein